MKTFISSDHAGFETKKIILQKYPEIIDKGPVEFIKDDDYPDYAYILSKEILKDPINSKGILICKNGVGICIASNKFPKIRSGLTFSVNHLKSVLEDDNPNIICLPAEFVGIEEILEMVGIFLKEKFQPQPRHERRIGKIEILENSLI